MGRSNFQNTLKQWSWETLWRLQSCTHFKNNFGSPCDCFQNLWREQLAPCRHPISPSWMVLIRNHQLWQQIDFAMPYMSDIHRIRRAQFKKGEDEKHLRWRHMFFSFIDRYLHACWINCFPKFNITDKAESTTVQLRIIKNVASFRPITIKKRQW